MAEAKRQLQLFLQAVKSDQNQSEIILSKLEKEIILASNKVKQLSQIESQYQLVIDEEENKIKFYGQSQQRKRFELACVSIIKQSNFPQKTKQDSQEIQNPGIFQKQLEAFCKVCKVTLFPASFSFCEFFYQIYPEESKFDQKFKRYNLESELKLAEKWKEFLKSKQAKITFILTVGKVGYQIEFNNKIQGEGLVGVQTNKMTLKSRAIKKSIEESKGQDRVRIQGLQNNINQIKKLWDQSFKFRLRAPLKLQLFEFHKARLMKQLNLEQIQAQLNQNGVVISIHIKGPHRVKAKEAFVSLYYESKSFPSYWEEFKQKLRIVQLEPGSQKYQEVEKAFKKTMSDAKILKIEMVMHKDNFNDFQILKEGLVADGYPELTMRLFHGSRDIPTEKLIHSNEGLDPQFSNDSGMWGRAVYFAQNASYSDAYAFQLQGGLKEMLYCEVYIGRYCQMKSDSSLRNTPDGHTSVKGNIDGSDVYIVYKNDRSYIDCVITYTCNVKGQDSTVGYNVETVLKESLQQQQGTEEKNSKSSKNIDFTREDFKSK